MNKIIQGDCLEKLKELENNSVDLTVTSPPYDNLRTYNGYTFNFEGIAKELYRVTKQGGVVVWVVGDATINGSETGTSFKQALCFKEMGFNLHDTMIYEKGNPIPNNSNRYTPSFEYMFVLSKGNPKVFNPIKVQSKYAGKKASRTIISISGKRSHQSLKGFYGNTKKLSNIFTYNIGTRANDDIKHPAKFPEQLANDHILSWSNEGDTVLDPMAGSGTTLKMAKKNNRNYIGIEISPEYIEIINKRLTT